MVSALHRVNLNGTWRRMLGQPEPDLHTKDVEVLLRALAMVADGEQYTEPMSRFLNIFAKKSRRLDAAKIAYAVELFEAFFRAVDGMEVEGFRAGPGRFGIAMFEAVFWATCADAFKARSTTVWPVTVERLAQLKADPEFVEATQYGIGRAAYVKKRYDRARALLAP